MAAAPGLVGAPQRGVVARRDVRLHVRAVDGLVRELADQVPGVPAAQLPPGVRRQPLDLGVQPLAGDVRVALEEAAPGREDLGQVVAQPLLDRIVAEHERPPEVGLVLLEDRPEVGEHDVVGADHPVRRILLVRHQCVRPRAHDPLVPVSGRAEQFVRQIADPVADRPLALPWGNQPARLDLREQLGRPRLSLQQPRRAHRFTVHTADRRCPAHSPATVFVRPRPRSGPQEPRPCVRPGNW